MREARKQPSEDGGAAQAIRGAAAQGAGETFNTVGKDERDPQATTIAVKQAAARAAE